MFGVIALVVITLWLVAKAIKKAINLDRARASDPVVEHVLGKRAHKEMEHLARRIESFYDRGGDKR